MLVTIFGILALTAFACCVASAVWPRCPVWIAVVFLCIIELLRVLPLK